MVVFLGGAGLAGFLIAGGELDVRARDAVTDYFETVQDGMTESELQSRLALIREGSNELQGATAMARLFDHDRRLDAISAPRRFVELAGLEVPSPRHSSEAHPVTVFVEVFGWVQLSGIIENGLTDDTHIAILPEPLWPANTHYFAVNARVDRVDATIGISINRSGEIGFNKRGSHDRVSTYVALDGVRYWPRDPEAASEYMRQQLASGG
jgi:hypothetical protein